MKILYNIGIFAFISIARGLSPFNQKARLWIKGRKSWLTGLRQKINPEEKYIWIHCASLGEFEQGRPVMEMIKSVMPEYKIVLTFFSPSGYEIRKNYPGADCICYLPADTPSNAKRFIDIINPSFAIFVKYEFWNNYISVLYNKKIPICLISGIFRPGQHFFKWYGSFFRKMLKKMSYIFVQDQNSVELLHKIGIYVVTRAGDTRFDRVQQIAAEAKEIPVLLKFRGNERLFLAGSSWPPDEEIIADYINHHPEKMKWVFAPHEIGKANIERLEKLFKVSSVRYSQFNESNADARVLIIDNIGMLSSAYRYAYIAAIGGGFGKGIHNILEPACWGIPVLFGPNHEKFREATEMKNSGGAGSFTKYVEFEEILEGWLNHEESYLKSAEAAGDYVKANTGATKSIIQKIMEKDINKSRS